MNKRIKRAIVFMMVFSVLLGSLPSFRDVSVKAADSDVIRNDETGIPDKALYQLILKELGKTPDSTFTEAEAQSVLAVQQDVFREGDSDRREEEQVVSLQGIEKLTNLSVLNLGRNKITDLKPLESLTKLTILRLEYSYCITNIEDLRSLTWLEYLALPPTVTDLSPIEGMTELRSLWVEYAGLRTLPDLTGHTKLTGFSTRLQGNNLTKKELTKKLPKKVVKDKAWLKQTIDLQEYNVKKMVKALKLTSPKKMTRITSKTKKITGKVDKNTWVLLCRPHSDHMPGWGLGHRRFNKNGVFEIKKLNLKKFKKKKLWLELYYKNSYYKNDMLIETLTIKLKK